MSRNRTRNLTPQIPGQPVAPVQQVVHQIMAPGETVTTSEESITSDAGVSDPQATTPTLDAAATETPFAQTQEPEANQEPVAPVQHEQVHPKSIKQPVLTKDGWLVPEV